MSISPSHQLLAELNALNDLFAQYNIAYRVSLPAKQHISAGNEQTVNFTPQIHSNALLDLYSAFFGISWQHPVQDNFIARVKSVKMLIGTLAQDVLKMDLGYIDPVAFVSGDQGAIIELVQVINAVGQIVKKKRKRDEEKEKSRQEQSQWIVSEGISDAESEESVEPVSGMLYNLISFRFVALYDLLVLTLYRILGFRSRLG